MDDYKGEKIFWSMFLRTTQEKADHWLGDDVVEIVDAKSRCSGVRYDADFPTLKETEVVNEKKLTG
ncbi:hypothetical protein DERF_003225 [Dermatophagoides farinae]|uniref:Uncharacterized protein n=1 Tax=Dermatophagoides farinae TaxID=6954 RepID=A0A922IFN5_DERFA|nr:hypothetical protein DERF_003225 [Dermatophagoides farinae]